MSDETIRAIIPVAEASPIDVAIAGWLHSHGKHTAQNQDGQPLVFHTRTSQAYEQTLAHYRASLQARGFDLDSDVRTLALAAQVYCTSMADKRGRPLPERRASKRTRNQRLAILSSFFQYAMKHRFLMPLDDAGHVVNPADPAVIERESVQAYTGGAPPLDAEFVAERLATIDRATRSGARDYALLAVLLSTGWRLSEVGGLTWRNVAIQESTRRVTLSYDHAKGDEPIRTELALPTSAALLEWLAMWYSPEALADRTIPPGAPVWVSLAHDASYGQKLGNGSIADICQKWLAESRVHATRHTLAVTMEDAGAKLTEIQEQLNQRNAATTSIYLQRKRRARNRHADTVAGLLGIE